MAGLNTRRPTWGKSIAADHAARRRQLRQLRKNSGFPKQKLYAAWFTSLAAPPERNGPKQTRSQLNPGRKGGWAVLTARRHPLGLGSSLSLSAMVFVTLGPLLPSGLFIDSSINGSSSRRAFRARSISFMPRLPWFGKFFLAGSWAGNRRFCLQGCLGQIHWAAGVTHEKAPFFFQPLNGQRYRVPIEILAHKLLIYN